MTTDPGDLVLDPTCGSGTTAYVAESWGRRWITIDTSRVAVALARQRLLTGTFDYYKLIHCCLGGKNQKGLEEVSSTKRFRTSPSEALPKTPHLIRYSQDMSRFSKKNWKPSTTP